MNLSKRYTNRMLSAVMNIKDIKVGMRVKASERLYAYDTMFNKDSKNLIGTVIGIGDCEGCRGFQSRGCSAHKIVVKLDRGDTKTMTDRIVNSCEYTFRTLQGYRIVSEGEYKYGGGKKL